MKSLLAAIVFTISLGLNAAANEVITLESLIDEALANNPAIKAAQSGWRASTKRPSQVSTLPNPTIGTRYMNVSFDELTLGEDNFTEFGVISVSQEIPFPGKLSLKGKIAEEEAEAEGQLVEATIREVIADLKEAYHDWFLVNKSIEITSKNKELLQRFARISEAKYEVGKGIQQDVIRAQLEVSGFIERLELLNQKKEIMEAKIRSILNRSPDSPLGRPEEMEKPELKLSAEELYKLAESRSPMLGAKKNLVERNNQALSLAKKQYFPDFVADFEWVSRGEFTNEGSFADLWQVKLGFIVPLYFWRKERLGVEEAALELQEARENYSSAENELLFNVKDGYVTAKTAEKLMELYETGIIPQSRLSLESAISGYQVGSVDFLTLVDNSVAVFNSELEYYRQLVEYRKAVARLEEIVGVELTK